MIATGVFAVIFFATYLFGMRFAKRGHISMSSDAELKVGEKGGY